MPLENDSIEPLMIEDRVEPLPDSSLEAHRDERRMYGCRVGDFVFTAYQSINDLSIDVVNRDPVEPSSVKYWPEAVLKQCLSVQFVVDRVYAESTNTHTYTMRIHSRVRGKID